MPWLRRHPALPPERRLWSALAVSGLLASAAGAQSAVSPPTRWSGWARCELAVSGAGYADRQSHFWVLANAPPTVQGAMQIHAATWSLAGSGSFQESNGRQTRAAQWTTDVPGMAAPIAFTVRASDGRLLIKPWHAQLRSPGAVRGTQQLIIDGVAQRPGPISLEAFEWAFPSTVESAGAERVSGTSTPVVTGRVGPMQPAGARATASCSWQLERLATTTAAGAPGERAVVAAGTSRAADLPLRDRSRFVVIEPRPTDPVSDYRWCVPSTDPPLSLDDQRTALAQCIADASQGIAENLTSRKESLLRAARPTAAPSPTPSNPGAPPPITTDAGVAPPATPENQCTLLVADTDARYSQLIYAAAAEYDRLIRTATTDADRRELTAAKANALKTLEEERAKAVADMSKFCQELVKFG